MYGLFGIDIDSCNFLAYCTKSRSLFSFRKVHSICILSYFILSVLIRGSISNAKNTDFHERTQPRIVGGRTVDPPDRYRFMAVVYKQIISSSDLMFTCGGSLISSNVVLTAAHCFNSADAVSLGKFLHDPGYDVNEYYEMFDIVDKRIHPKYNPSNFDNDIMLLKLNSTSSFQPATLHDGVNAKLLPGMPLEVVGWGTTSYGGPVSPELRVADVELVSNGLCSQNYAVIGDEITFNMLCARGDGTDACQGDSGGPLLTADGRDIIIGSISSGNGCAQWNFPGIYAKVHTDNTLNWIREMIQEWSPDSLVPTVGPFHSPSLQPLISETNYNNGDVFNGNSLPENPQLSSSQKTNHFYHQHLSMIHTHIFFCACIFLWCD